MRVDHQRNPAAIDQTRQKITPHIIGAQYVFCTGCCTKSNRVRGVRVQIQKRRKNQNQNNFCKKDDKAGYSQLMGGKTFQHVAKICGLYVVSRACLFTHAHISSLIYN